MLRWRPPHGVLSLSIDIDPTDRSERWRSEVKNGLRAAVDDAGEDGDRERRLAVRETAERLGQRLEEPLGVEARGVLGFVEARRREGDARWYGLAVPLRRTEVLYGPGPQLHSLLAILDEAAPRGLAAVSAERVRLFDWRLGRLEELHDWQLEVFSEDWRERKAQKPRDPAAGQATAAAGKDQYDQRLEHNRDRFVKQAGRLAAGALRERGWRELVVFGDRRYARAFESAFDQNHWPVRLEDAELVSEPAAKIQQRLEELLPRLNRERERELVDRVREAALAGGRGAIGLQETLQALSEGRAEHLVYDAERDYPEPGLVERMVELAQSTSAAITPVEAESAELLAEHEGVGALLRY